MRITFVTPHQGPTSGGVYAIHQYASLLAGTHDVTLAVAHGDLMSVPGCRVVPVDQASFSDVVVYPADLPIDDLPRGHPVCYLQGFGTPGNPEVIRNLGRRHHVIASARGLVQEAERRACPSAFVPYGIDTDVFYPPSWAKDRAPIVLMMTHGVDWKGTDDGLRALGIVRSDLPDAKILLFGGLQPDFESDFVLAPTRPEVAAMMRRAAVFVCSSWEEGFGMPGLEAMACGAALATTDTKGSRDYAEDGVSALVAPPRRPEALAEAVLTLLTDTATRRRVAAGGLGVAATYPSWPESASMFEEVLLAIASS